jgi:hypothetical protein
MAPYVFALILLLGIPFLLYCLWNFAREAKPRRRLFFMSSALPSLGSAQRVPMPRLMAKSASVNAGAKPRRPDRDFTTAARVS